VTSRPRRPLTIAAAAAATAALAAAGCGGKGATSTTRAPATQPTTAAKTREAAFAVTEREYSLSPSRLEVPSTGEFTISVRNAGSVRHALEVEGPAGEVRTGPLGPGSTAQLKVKLTKPGRYEWYCPIDDHKGRGMRGTIVVAGGGSGGGKHRDRRRHGSGGGSGSPDRMHHDGGASGGSSGGGSSGGGSGYSAPDDGSGGGGASPSGGSSGGYSPG
jgi:uncharacterized cupredoxin-like copper-binding protein